MDLLQAIRPGRCTLSRPNLQYSAHCIQESQKTYRKTHHRTSSGSNIPSSLLTYAQTSSSVYGKDLCVTKFLNAYGYVANAYREHGNRLPDEDRLDPATFKECINVDWCRYQMTDEEVDGVAKRWQKSRFLRELYLDEEIAKEFADFRSDFVSPSAAEDRFTTIKPGVTTLCRVSPGYLQNQPYGPDFKERFHHALCANTVAVASHQLAKACRENITLEDGELLDAVPHEDIVQAVSEYWTRSRWYIRGIVDDLDLFMKVDSLEVFDFLYMFLLQKILPFGNYAAWTEADAMHWSEEGGFLLDEKDHAAPIGIQKWHTLLDDCRKAFQPLDLVDLIKGGAWAANSEYPPDKSIYLRVRGVFDAGESESIDWGYFYRRAPIVYRICPMESQVFDLSHEDTELPCWWDRVRLACGSPFAEGFEEKQETEIAKMLEQEKQEKQEGSTNPALGIPPGTSPWAVLASLDSFLRENLE